MTQEEKNKILNSPPTTQELIDSLRHMGNDHECCETFWDMAAERMQSMKNDIKTLMDIFESKEETSEGREFHPTTINSCRTQDYISLQGILNRFKGYTNE